jgi:hypothetical protein
LNRRLALLGLLRQRFQRLDAIDQRAGQVKRVLDRQDRRRARRAAAPIQILNPLAILRGGKIRKGAIVRALELFQAPRLFTNRIGQQKRVQRLGMRPPDFHAARASLERAVRVARERQAAILFIPQFEASADGL